jgi:aspartate racemase
MKTIGLLGGMSWESTSSYYRAINQGIKQRLGGLHSAKICLYSVDFADIEQLQHRGDWEKTAQILSAAARSVEAGGADFLLVCSNTMHKVAPQIEAAISIPLLHIVDGTATALLRDKISRVGLLGTGFTMEQDFYKGRLTDHFGIEVTVTEPEQQNSIHNIIYQELCLGVISDQSRQRYLEVIEQLQHCGAQGVILGCTEIALLLQQSHTSVPLYDTTAIHAASAVELALSQHP